MGFCVFCGAALTDYSHCGSCGAVKVGDTWHESAAPVVGATGDSGWRPDPTGRHEGRYFVSGQATDLARDGDVEVLDPVGKVQMEGAVAQSGSSSPKAKRRHRRRKWAAVSAAVLVVAVVGAGIGTYLYVNREQVDPEVEYLKALQQSGYAGEFNSDANAVARGRQVCRQLSEGAPQEGMPADEVAVQYFCPEFAEGFHVLETATITGTFTLNDDSPSAYSPSIEVDGSSCEGAGGYSDVNPGTPVTVKNGKGEILTTTYLEEGRGGRYMCTFGITFEVTEGQDRYVVNVGRRGELSFSFAELKANGVSLVLGGS
ncbi:DUF732 domain-containing protein [Mycobacterium sp. AMU20-3851]|uniref:DUF732 domain-containing protein n=1 Tax=Mycobacterium sp. AMU20-3851 TaxID=3122055 RepID=UPI0037549A62